MSCLEVTEYPGGILRRGDGLTKTINTTGNACIDTNGKLYICCNEGISVLDTEHIWYNEVQPIIKVTRIDIDGTSYEFDDLNDGLVIKSDASKVTIDFAVFSYTNRSNIKVEYRLEGFESNPTELHGDDVLQAVYTNLDGGVYTFTVNAYNGDGTACAEPLSFVIEKEKSVFESPMARIIDIQSGNCIFTSGPHGDPCQTDAEIQDLCVGAVVERA